MRFCRRAFLKVVVAVAAIGFVLFNGEAIAALPAGAVKLSPSDIFQTTSSGKRYTCGHIGSSWIPGRLISGYFLSTKREISNLKKLMKRTSNAATRRKYSSSLKKLQVALPLGTEACVNGNTTPTSNPNFDPLGNLTEAGKAAFLVPSNLNGSANRGFGLWNSFCYSCHAQSIYSISIKNYPELKKRLTESPMFFSIPGEVTEQNIADIVAARNY